MRKEVLFVVGILVFVSLVYANSFSDSIQSNFNNGTYLNTIYNGSAVVLSGTNLTGNFTSRIFDAGANVRWDNLSWQGNESDIELLFAVDNSADVWKSANSGLTWTKVNDDYNAGDNNGVTDMAKNSSGALFVLNNQDIWSSVNDGVIWTKVNDDYNGAEGQNGYVLGIDNNDNLFIIEGDHDVWKSIDSVVSGQKFLMILMEEMETYLG
mgnify:CR=1 FL=1